MLEVALFAQTKRAAANALRGALRLYRRWLSPLLGPRCRFHPTCSRYASIALSRHGLRRGSLLAAKRLLRCHPLHPGGVDPVPPAEGA